MEVKVEKVEVSTQVFGASNFLRTELATSYSVRSWMICVVFLVQLPFLESGFSQQDFLAGVSSFWQQPV